MPIYSPMQSRFFEGFFFLKQKNGGRFVLTRRSYRADFSPKIFKKIYFSHFNKRIFMFSPGGVGQNPFTTGSVPQRPGPAVPCGNDLQQLKHRVNSLELSVRELNKRLAYFEGPDHWTAIDRLNTNNTASMLIPVEGRLSWLEKAATNTSFRVSVLETTINPLQNSVILVPWNEKNDRL